MDLPIPLDRDRLADWRQRWNVRELAVFGSVLRSDFGPSSDVDLLVTFNADARWSLIDHERMEQDLPALIAALERLVPQRPS